MYPSDEYLVYANEVDALCYANPIKCYIDKMGTSESGDPTSGWIYNSNNLEGQNNIYNNWFISPNVSNSLVVFLSGGGGALYFSDFGYLSEGVRPVLYLSSFVKITEGTGEQNNPYKLGL